METSPAGSVHDKAADALAALVASWRRSLAARRASAATIDTYSTAVGQVAEYLAAHRMPDRVTTIRGGKLSGASRREAEDGAHAP